MTRAAQWSECVSSPGREHDVTEQRATVPQRYRNTGAQPIGRKRAIHVPRVQAIETSRWPPVSGLEKRVPLRGLPGEAGRTDRSKGEVCGLNGRYGNAPVIGLEPYGALSKARKV
jgi:hypothetical protein